MLSPTRDRWISGLRALFARGPQSYLAPGSEAVRYARINFRAEEDQWTIARTLSDALSFLDSQFRVLSTAGLAREQADGSYHISDHLARRLFDLWVESHAPKAHPKIALQLVDEFRGTRVSGSIRTRDS